MNPLLKYTRAYAHRRRDSIQDLRNMRRSHKVDIEQPLVLISQINRSGGTLLSQLFSGHHQCHVYPGELLIGIPKENWPDLDLNGNAGQWFRCLYTEHLADFSKNGYIKVPKRLREKYQASDITFPFSFMPKLMELLFKEQLEAQTNISQRTILNAYFTAFFNSWLDYQSLYTEKKWLVAFTPKLSTREDSIERFFNDYPNGRLISCIRDPGSWYASIHRKRPELTVEQAIPRWIESTKAAFRNKNRYSDQVHLVNFDTLLKDTKGTIGGVANWLNIEKTEILNQPTFQTLDIRANSSWKVEQSGVIDTPLNRASELDDTDRKKIEKMGAELYQKALVLTGSA